MRNCVHLITYANRLGGGRLEDLQRLFDGPFKGILGGVHILPFFIQLMALMPGSILSIIQLLIRRLERGVTSLH